MSQVPTVLIDNALTKASGASASRALGNYLGELADVKSFGAKGDGSTNDLAAFQAAANSGATAVWVPPASYNFAGGTLTLPNNVGVIGAGYESNLIQARVRSIGTIGSEVPLNAPLAAGDQTINFATAGFAQYDYVYLKSCINCLSTDAGNDQLAFVPAWYAFFAEYVRLTTVGGSSATISDGTIFPYSNTPGPNSHGRTTSTIARIAFNEGIIVRGLRFTGAHPTAGTSYVFLNWCYGPIVELCYFDTGTVNAAHVLRQNCLDSMVRDNEHRRAPNASQTATGSLFNSVLSYSSQNSRTINNLFDGGNQCVDSDVLLGNGPDINPICEGNKMMNAFEGCTTHPGAYGGSLSFNSIDHCIRGVRVRTKRTRVIGNDMINNSVASPSGIGVFAAGGFLDGTIIANNVITGFDFGMQLQSDDASGDPPVPGRCLVSGNTITDSQDIGIYLTRATATALQSNFSVIGNTIECAATEGILVQSYVNGTVLDGNICIGPFGGLARAGIEFGTNIQNLTITNNKAMTLGAGVYGIRGPGTTAFITDSVTFPGGEADAHLIMANNYAEGLDTGHEYGNIPYVPANYVEIVNSWGIDVMQGKRAMRQIPNATGDLLAIEDSTGTTQFGIQQAGQWDGVLPNAVAGSILSASTVSGLAIILASLFANVTYTLPGGWTPLSLGSKCIAWWNVDDAGSISLSGASVTAWADQVASYSLAQATAAKQPQYSATGWNSSTAGITFDGINDCLILASLPAPFPIGTVESQIFMRLSQTANAADTTIRIAFDYGGSLSPSYRRILRQVVSGVNRLLISTGSSNLFDTTTDFSGDNYVGGTYITGGTNLAGFINGVAIPVGGAGSWTTTSTNVVAGADSAGANNFWQGVIGDIVVTTQLLPSEAAILNLYLASKM